MYSLVDLRQDTAGEPVIPASEKVLYSTTTPVTIGDEKTVYFKAADIAKPRIILTERSLYFLSNESLHHALYVELLNIHSYSMKDKAKAKNALIVEITPVINIDKCGNSLVNTPSDYPIEISFTKKGKKPVPGERTAKEEHDLFLAHLTGAIEAQIMASSLLHANNSGGAQTPQDAPKLERKSTVSEAPAHHRADHTSDSKQCSLFELFDPRHYSVFNKDSSVGDHLGQDPPKLAMPMPESATASLQPPAPPPPEDGIQATVDMKVLSFMLGFPADDIPTPSLAMQSSQSAEKTMHVINRLMLQVLQARVIQAPIPAKPYDLLSVSVQSSMIGTQLVNSRSPSQKTISPATLDPRNTNTSAIASAIAAAYRSYPPIVTSLSHSEYTSSQYNMHFKLQLMQPNLTANVLARHIPDVLVSYTDSSPFYAAPKFKLVPVDEVYTVINRMRPAYPVPPGVFADAVKIAENAFLKDREDKIPITCLPAFVPWSLDGTYYFVEVRMRAGMLFDAVIVTLLYDEMRARRDRGCAPSTLYTYVTSNDVAMRLGLPRASAVYLLNSLVKRLLLAVEVHEKEQRYYLNKITNHYRSFQKVLMQTSKPAA